jgi:purine-binding chemotaxis protein CheW
VQTLEHIHSEAVAPAVTAGRYLSFFLGEEEYAFEVHRVREILGESQLTPVPGSHPSIRGVLNRRGEVIPVIDLRARLGLDEMVEAGKPCIIILLTASLAPVGVAVDRVADVLDISESDLSSPSNFLTAENDDFLVGFGKIEARLKLILDVDQILAEVE